MSFGRDTPARIAGCAGASGSLVVRGDGYGAACKLDRSVRVLDDAGQHAVRSYDVDAGATIRPALGVVSYDARCLTFHGEHRPVGEPKGELARSSCFVRNCR
jgi:hypothetical protein